MCCQCRLLISEQIFVIENLRQSSAFFAVNLVAKAGRSSVVLVKRTV